MLYPQLMHSYNLLFWSLRQAAVSLFAMNQQENQQTHFGYETVAVNEKAGKVMGVFSSVASKYDIMNDAMSAGMHRLWKCRMLSMSSVRPDSVALDVAAGSGDIAIGLLKKMRKGGEEQGRVVLTDLNGSMLAEGARRVVDEGYLPGAADCIQSDGTKLPFADNSVDSVTIAFGIRNFVDVDAGLAEFYRVLKPGGQFMCLEFSKPVLPLLDVVYDAYSFNVIPALGELITGDRESYQYLVESIRRFPDQQRFERMIQHAGFDLVRHENMTGGVVALHRGYKV